MYIIFSHSIFKEKMIGYITLLFSCLTKAITYKNGSALAASFGTAIMLTGAENIWKAEFFGFSYSFLILAVALIMVDFVTGALASRHEQQNKDGWFNSEKISLTVYKFLSLFLLLWISNELYNITFNSLVKTDSNFWEAMYGSTLSTIALARTTVFTLICGREYISIGENIARRFGKKFYCFVIFEKLLDIVELKFIKKIESSVCQENTKEDETNK